MRIAIDGRFLTDHYPGIGRYLFNLLPPLARLAMPDSIAVLVDIASRNRRFDLDRLGDAGIHFTETRVPARRADEQFVLPRWARRVEADVLHVPFWWTAFRLPCPLVVTIFDTIPLDVPSTLSPGRLLIYRLAARITAKRARRVLTPSRAAHTQIEHHFSLASEKVRVTPPAADPAYAPVAPEVVEGLRHRLDLPATYVLSLAGGKPHKNLSRLLEAWEHLPQQPIQATLVLAGLHQRARATRMELPRRVRDLGEIDEDDLPALLTGAELLAVPSLSEGFGLPVVEAMACATPVACSRIPAFDEVAGNAALFFDPHDAASIATALGRLLTDFPLRSRLIQEGLRRARSFSWEETARRTLTAYRQALQ